jgi:glutaredoxin-related protein
MMQMHIQEENNMDNKITVYGSNTCPGTLRFLAVLTEHHYMPHFVNITGSIQLLKEFVYLRDTLPCYEGLRGTDKVGFPLIKLPDGTYTRDVAKVLTDLGIDPAEFSFIN